MVVFRYDDVVVVVVVVLLLRFPLLLSLGVRRPWDGGRAGGLEGNANADIQRAFIYSHRRHIGPSDSSGISGPKTHDSARGVG